MRIKRELIIKVPIFGNIKTKILENSRILSKLQKMVYRMTAQVLSFAVLLDCS
jgi:hypothetical protein